MNETSPDEDVLAVDCTVEFAEAAVRVQVKCTSQLSISGRSASWPVEESWLQAWSKAEVPAYFLLVIVPADQHWWLDHQDNGTFHQTAAFWCRLRRDEIGTRIHVPKSQRLTSETLDEWYEDLLAVFKAGATS